MLDNGMIKEYRGKVMGDLDLHILAVAEEAYMKLKRELRAHRIIVSGESETGKTTSFQVHNEVLRAVGGCASNTQIETKMLSSSSIMEMPKGSYSSWTEKLYSKCSKLQVLPHLEVAFRPVLVRQQALRLPGAV